jgi:hypothetical protein
MIGEIRGKQFEGDRTMEPQILGAEHHAHAATTELVGNAVMGNGFALHHGSLP